MIVFRACQCVLGWCLQEWPPAPGVFFPTCVLCWSYADESFWRGSAIAMAEVVSYSKNMAVTRFREAGSVAMNMSGKFLQILAFSSNSLLSCFETLEFSSVVFLPILMNELCRC